MPLTTADLGWGAVLAHHATRTPDKVMLTFEGTTTTYAQMAGRVATLAGGLADRGVGPGDVVGLLSWNCPEMLEVIWAANHVGAIAMPVNWRLAAAEVRFILEHSGAKVLVHDEACAATADEAATGLGVTLARTDDLDAVRGAAAERVAAAGDDVHRLMYTSGTTGRPKGVMLTHDNLAWKSFSHIVELAYTADDLGLACGPLYHVGALDLTMTSLIAAGGSAIVHRQFDAAAVVDEIERSRVTCVWLAPAMVNAIMALPDVERRDFSSLRLVINGGEKMPIPLIERIQRTFPATWFADAYGMTETVSGDTFLDRDSLLAKRGSVGRPVLHLELQLWDDDGRPVPSGERGEIVMRGPKVFRGYWRDPEATERAFAGGWFHSGDVGVLDSDGYLFIVDRLKDMIISGGENIAGSEVERVLYEHPAVLECAVVGAPHERWGEVPVAFVALREGAATSEEELIEHCRGQLAKFKVPTAVTLIDALPRNPSGKVLKRELRGS